MHSALFQSSSLVTLLTLPQLVDLAYIISREALDFGGISDPSLCPLWEARGGTPSVGNSENACNTFQAREP